MIHRMTFDEFQELNARRCREVWAETLANGWTLDDWAHKLAEEVGEVCRVFTRVKDGRIALTAKRPELLKELADVISMADLMITALQANTQDTVIAKFEEVSARHEWTGRRSIKLLITEQWMHLEDNVLVPSTCSNCGGGLFVGMDHTCPHRNVAPLGASA